ALKIGRHTQKSGTITGDDLMKRFILVAGVTAVALVAMALPVAAADHDGYSHSYEGDYYCTGVVVDTWISGDVYVEYDERCVLKHVAVSGNVLVDHGKLKVKNSYVYGNVEADYAKQLRVIDSVVKGNVVAAYTKTFYKDGVEKPSAVKDSKVKGNIRLEHNMAKVAVKANTAKGNVEMYDNYGQIRVIANYVAGNIDCEGNLYPPRLRDNTFSGNVYCP
ncbi:MAG: hypothetical protein ACR2NL_09270, partial [Acidimicrobiia bacterium]